MEFFETGTEGTSSNIDTDADVTAFDTNLPAAHNVSAIFLPNCDSHLSCSCPC